MPQNLKIPTESNNLKILVKRGNIKNTLNGGKSFHTRTRIYNNYGRLQNPKLPNNKRRGACERSGTLRVFELFITFHTLPGSNKIVLFFKSPEKWKFGPSTTKNEIKNRYFSNQVFLRFQNCIFHSPILFSNPLINAKKYHRELR